MRACLKKLADADCVYFLSGWRQSEGASLERYISSRLGIPCANGVEELKNIVEARQFRRGVY
jgi:tryptophan 2,3-dioxygenase